MLRLGICFDSGLAGLLRVGNEEEISDNPGGFLLSVRMGGRWGDWLRWRKVFEGKS